MFQIRPFGGVFVMILKDKKEACTESSHNGTESTMALKRVLTWLFCILLFFSSLTSPAWSWTADPTQNTPISTATNSQYNPMMASDGSGGAIIVWEDFRSGEQHIYAQRLNSVGNRLWENITGSGDFDGIPVCTATGTQSRLGEAVSDGAGGAIITWRDERAGTGDIYAQRIDSSGKRLWENGTGSGDFDGIPVSTATGAQQDARIISDGCGGAITTWCDRRNWFYSDVYAQRIDSDGNRLWENGTGSGDFEGIPIASANYIQGVAGIVSDGSGGGIIIWRDDRSGQNSNHLYAQRLDPNGSRVWENGIGSGDFDGILVSTDHVNIPRVVRDGSGGAVISWYTCRPYDSYGPMDVYAQRIDSNGSRLWENGTGSGDYNGIPISTASDKQQYPEIIGDGSGGAIITWRDYRADSGDIYAQRIDSNGIRLWENGAGSDDFDGIPISTATSCQLDPRIVGDGSGGAIVTWRDYRADSGNIYAQRIDWNGNRVWENGVSSGDFNGIIVSSDDTSHPTTVSDSTGGAIIAWEVEDVNDRYDIYAQRVYSDGNLSTVITPSNVSPEDTAYTGLTPTLTSTPFEDTAGEVTHAASQWQLSERSDFAPDTIQATLSDDNGYIEYTLPFMFPFFGRDISSISANTNGLIELLEDGESCYECDSNGTHEEGNHLDEIDAIFASNDDLETEDGFLNIYKQGSYVMIEWFGSTYYDNDSTANPIHFQVEIHANGTINWNFKQMDFSYYDYDMYSGIYPNGGAEIDVGYAINAQSSWSFDPATQLVSQISFNWDVPNPYFLYDSGETVSDLTEFAVPAVADLAYCSTYFWRVRYKTNIGDWTPWSNPTRFAVSRPGDSDNDGDVDGSDLAYFAADFNVSQLAAFTAEFGRTNCFE